MNNSDIIKLFISNKTKQSNRRGLPWNQYGNVCPNYNLKAESNNFEKKRTILYQTTKFWTSPTLKHLQMTKYMYVETCLWEGRKHCGKRRKCWLPAFSPFPKMFSKGSFFRVVKSQDCVVKG